ncbi:MAG: lysophospholipid acyltransferase family protein [Deltaproteobacteria bacterium]|nr:lysophospholipid acyltransferase family protein [Deltaproteobacteria bacterium]
MKRKISDAFKISLSLSKFCQARINVMIFRCLPFQVSRLYLRLIGRFYFFLKWKEKALICRAIRYVLEGNRRAGEVKPVTKKTFGGIIDHYHEKLFVAYSNFKRLLRFLDKRIHLHGADALQEALAEGKGVILVTGHFGAVEFLPGCLAVKGYPVTMICRFQTDRLRASLKERAEKVNLELIDAANGNVFLTAVKALKEGRILITECDEFDEWRPSETHKRTSFLNADLVPDRTLDLLQKRSGARMVVGLVQRKGRKRYTLKLDPVAKGEGAGVKPVGVECLSVLQEAIYAHPTQWYQWKKFGQMILPAYEAEHDHQESGYLAPEAAVSLSFQA